MKRKERALVNAVKYWKDVAKKRREDRDKAINKCLDLQREIDRLNWLIEKR